MLCSIQEKNLWSRWRSVWSG